VGGWRGWFALLADVFRFFSFDRSNHPRDNASVRVLLMAPFFRQFHVFSTALSGLDMRKYLLLNTFIGFPGYRQGPPNHPSHGGEPRGASTQNTVSQVFPAPYNSPQIKNFSFL
jgi:hypothetical protein